MRPGYSPQFNTGVVILEEKDVSVDPNDVIVCAYRYEATLNHSEDGLLFIVRFPDGRNVDEAYTDRALRSSLASFTATDVA